MGQNGGRAADGAGAVETVIVALRTRCVAEAVAAELTNSGVGARGVPITDLENVVVARGPVVLAVDGAAAGCERAVAGVRRQAPSVRVVGIGPPDSLSVAERLSAVAWVSSSASVSDLVDTIRGAIDGRQERANHWPSPAPGPVSEGSLTDREVEVLHLLAEGGSTEEIGGWLGISANTVRTHVQNVMAKLGVHSRLELVTEARRAGHLTERTSRR